MCEAQVNARLADIRLALAEELRLDPAMSQEAFTMAYHDLRHPVWELWWQAHDDCCYGGWSAMLGGRAEGERGRRGVGEEVGGEGGDAAPQAVATMACVHRG